MLEILRHVLSSYPGARRLAMASRIMAFAGAFCLTFVPWVVIPAWSAGGITVELERNLRTFQAMILLVILVVISYYRIPISRNMKGVMFGCGLYVGIDLISLAVWPYAGLWLQNVWVLAPPISFLISLSIWKVMLWSYHPDPVPESSAGLEADYELLASRTKRTLDTTRSYLASGRPRQERC